MRFYHEPGKKIEMNTENCIQLNPSTKLDDSDEICRHRSSRCLFTQAAATASTCTLVVAVFFLSHFPLLRQGRQAKASPQVALKSDQQMVRFVLTSGPGLHVLFRDRLRRIDISIVLLTERLRRLLFSLSLFLCHPFHRPQLRPPHRLHAAYHVNRSGTHAQRRQLAQTYFVFLLMFSHAPRPFRLAIRSVSY